jgi:hypothetical protein
VSTPVSTRPENASATPGAWSQGSGTKKPSTRWKAARLSRRIPYLLLGSILVIACAAAAMVVSTQLGDRQSVLMLAHPVSVGQLLSTQDLRHVSMPTNVGADVVPAAESSTVLGRPVAYSMPAGTLITRVLVGAPAIPPAGQAVAAVGLAAGQFPPALASGTRVAVLVSAASSSSGAPGVSGSTVVAPIAQWVATVVEVGASPTDQQTTVVSLLLPEDEARQLGAVPDGQVNLVALSGGGR